jgi:hypothetical protein
MANEIKHGELKTGGALRHTTARVATGDPDAEGKVFMREDFQRDLGKASKKVSEEEKKRALGRP